MSGPNVEPRWPALLVGLAAMALVLLLFGPALPGLGARFLGVEEVDAYGTHWFYWFVGRQLSALEPFGQTDLFFYPFGKDIYRHTGANVLDAIVAQPFYALLGPTLGYNVFVLFALVVNGLAAWPLMGQFTQSRAARLVGVTLYALNPYLLSELREGRPTQVFQPFLPLFFYHLLRFETAGRRHALWGAIHLALTAFTYWFYAIFAGLVAVVHFLQRAILHPEPRRFFGRHVAAGLLSLAFVMPAALPLMAATLEGDAPGLLLEPVWPFLEIETLTIEGVQIGLHVFQPWLRANGFLTGMGDGSLVFSPSAPVLTLTQIALVALGLLLSRHRWVLGAMLGMAALLAVGHLVWLGGPSLPNPLYVLMVKVVPFMRRLWWPGRAMVLVGLLGGVLAAAGLGELERRRGRVLATMVGLLATAAFGAELVRLGYAPFPTWSATIPPGYRCLAEGPPGALIELPYARSQAHLYYQTGHGRPILGGMVEDNPVFTPAEQRALITSNSFAALLLSLGDDPRAKGEYSPEDKEALGALGYRYVVVQHQSFMASAPDSRVIDTGLTGHSGALNRRLTALLGRPVYVDPDITIYAPWGDPSPCGDPGPGRTAWETRQPEKGVWELERVVIGR